MPPPPLVPPPPQPDTASATAQTDNARRTLAESKGMPTPYLSES